MKLISCYIAGFGKITNYSHDFTDGLNTFYEENGWGKTTFSVFIKAMFYGMEYSPRKKELTEREHYYPWDSSNYGGNLVLEVEGKKYRIERSFGKTNKDDTYLLIDVATNKESDRFSEKIGEELFQVDRDSFEKSIFIPQDALNTTMTDSLNAKMGNLSSAKDDVNNFDLAMNRVEEAKRSYTRNSKINPGQVPRIRQEMRNVKEQLEQLPALNDGYEKKAQLIDEKRVMLRQLEKEKEVLAEQIRQQSKNEQQLGAYREKKELLEKEKELVLHLDDFFAKGIPDMEEQQQIEEQERAYAILAEKIQELEGRLPAHEDIARWNELFVREQVKDHPQGEPAVTTGENYIPSPQQFMQWNQQAARMHELRIQGKHSQMSEENRRQLAELKEYFGRKCPTEHEMDHVEDRMIRLAKLEGKISEVETRHQSLLLQRNNDLRQMKAAKNPAALITIIIMCSALVVCGGILQQMYAGNRFSIFTILCFVAAIFIASIYFMASRRKSQLAKQNMQGNQEQLELCQEQMNDYKLEREELLRKSKEFLSYFLVTPTESMQQMAQEIRRKLDEYQRLLREEEQTMKDTTGTMDELSDTQLQLYTALERYANAYHMDLYHEPTETQLLSQLKNDGAEYEKYIELCEKIQTAKQESEHYREIIMSYVLRFPVEEKQSIQEKLLEIRKNMQSSENATERILKLTKEINAFQQENQVDENIESVENLQERQLHLDGEISELNRVITVEKDSLAHMSERLEECEDAESNLELLQEQLKECEEKVQVLEKTSMYLQKAKEQFLSKYMGPLQNSLQKYLNLLSVDHEESFTLDMDLSIRFIHQGSSKEGDYLSAGYRDLAALCSRFALLDVLYQKEQPVIVLDDPFTNFDEARVKKAKELLQKIAAERQVIYYTCHESRKI